VVGPSGTGKSIRLRMPSRPALLPSEGEAADQRESPALPLRIDHLRPPECAPVSRTGPCSVSPHGGQNVRLSALIATGRCGTRDLRQVSSKALDAVGTARPSKTQLPGELSGGMQKRVSFARRPDRRCSSQSSGQHPLCSFDERRLPASSPVPAPASRI